MNLKKIYAKTLFVLRFTRLRGAGTKPWPAYPKRQGGNNKAKDLSFLSFTSLELVIAQSPTSHRQTFIPLVYFPSESPRDANSYHDADHLRKIRVVIKSRLIQLHTNSPK